MTGESSQRTISKSIGVYKLSSNLRQAGYSVLIIDHFIKLLGKFSVQVKEILTKNIGSKTLVLGFSSTFISFNDIPLIVKTINTVKSINPNIKIVVGGNKIPLLNSIDQHIDYYVQGLAEESFLQLVKEIELNKTDIPKFWNDDIFADSYNFSESIPAFSLHDSIQKRETLPLELSRGCRFKCKFCSYPLLGRNPRSTKYIRSEYSIAKELESNYNNFETTNYIITCDTFNETTEKLLTFKRSIDSVGIKINFASFLRLDIINAHREQIDILKEIGLASGIFGIESLNDKAAKAVGKGLGRDNVINILNILRQTWGNQIRTSSNFISGLPHETKETLDEWIGFLCTNEVKLHFRRIIPLFIPGPRSPGFHSEFTREHKKYGYELTDMGWQNENLTCTQAKEITEYWNPILEETNEIAGFNFMSLRNFKLDTLDVKNRNISIEDSLEKKFNEYLNNYISRLLNK